MNWKDRVSLGLYRNRAGFRLLELNRRLRAPGQWIERRAAARDLAPLLPDIPVDQGYRWIQDGELPHLDEALRGLEAAVANMRPHLTTLVEAQPPRYRSCIELLSDEGVEQVPGLLDLACSIPVLSVVARYLGAAPCLGRVALGYSPGLAESGPGGAQLYHADGEDRSQVKLFLLVTPTAMEQGPLHLIPADESRRVQKRWGRGSPDPPHARMRAGGYTDKQVQSVVSPENIVHHTGPAGRALFADTSRCLHFGSRVPLGRERLSVMLAYRRFHVVNPTPTNSFRCTGRFDHPLQRLALQNSQGHPPGFFFPDRLAFPGPENRGARRSREAKSP